ncbi:MAG TPA: hypothetical protein VFJ15_05435 [Oleiagrimonas sp.]|nr:hypothetical protein [Oleiagrimonas sp.]
MNTATETQATDESRSAGRTAARVVWKLFLIGCGFALFVAAGIAGGMAGLNWFA